MVDMTEYEGKILDVDVESVTAAILKAGGTKVGDYTFRRYVFDVVPAKKGTWIRLRTNGDETTLTVKEIKNNQIDGTSEWEVVVSDFDTAFSILQKSGHIPKGYQENRRIEFSLGDAMLAIDFWPKLQPYLEIEAKNKKAVEAIAEKLGFKSPDLVGDNTIDLYQAIGIDLDQVEDLRFES